MSIVERASKLFEKQAPPAPVPIEQEVTGKFDTAAVDLIERSIASDVKPAYPLEDDGPAAAHDLSAMGTMGNMAEGPASQKVTPTLIIDPDRLRQQNMTTPDGERTAVSESFRRIKRHILANVSNPDAPPGTNLVMITSSMPKEGKTFCTVNLAISLAMEMDRRVLLVDADVLRPSVLAALGIKSVEKGLMDVLLDGLNLSDVLCNTNIEKLSLLSSGRRHAHASELLASDAMREMLREMAERYRDRIIIFDSPPLLATTESCVLASLMGQVLVVVEAGQTTEATLKDALGRIQSNNVVGVLLNKGGAPGSGLYGGYGYGYGYGYGEGGDTGDGSKK
jgi:receptor protein-tyrosine kinase